MVADILPPDRARAGAGVTPTENISILTAVRRVGNSGHIYIEGSIATDNRVAASFQIDFYAAALDLL